MALEEGAKPYIVSLTSYAPRFPTLHACLKSLLKQSTKPDKICLWIAEDEIKQLPKSVVRLCRNKIDIIPCPDIKSFKKIIYCLKKHPNANIITCDDDVIYPSDWLRHLINANKADPNTIICHRARYMHFNPRGETNPYWLWPNIKKEFHSKLVFPIGVGGVLYPPDCFHSDIFNQEIFMDLCPAGDDIWLKTMSLLNGTKCKKLSVYKKDFKMIKGSQTHALKTDNINQGNDAQIRKTFEHYSINSLLKQDNDL